MDLGNGLGHLTYSTLVHPGDTWDEMWSSLTTYVPQVKARVAPERALRRLLAAVRGLGADACRQTRSGEPSCSSFLDDNDLYLYTVNAFPVRAVQGPCRQGAGVRARLAHRGAHRSTRSTSPTCSRTCRARASQPSIQTAPLGVQAERHGPRRRRQRTRSTCCDVAAHLVRLEQRTGRTVTLAIEPEPYCFLETTDETVAYFEEHLYSGDGSAAARRGSPGSRSRRRTSPCAATSASCSTSATRRSSTRTSASR